MSIYLSFIESREIARSLGITSCKKWQQYTRSSSFNASIPKAPDSFYKEWTNWYDFLGKSSGRKYRVNENFFKTWSHDMAYILGLWFSDGCIGVTDNGSCRFYISQHSKDKYLLLNILKKMESNHPIRIQKNTNVCRLIIASREIYHDIIRLGGKEKKSLDVKFPKVPKKYLPDFIRGLWDGDGCISGGRWSITKKRFYGFNASICGGSRMFILNLKKALEKNIKGINVVYYKRFRKGGSRSIQGRILTKDNTMYSLSLSPNNVKILRDFMYDTPSDLKLMRKYKKFVEAGEYRQCSRDIKYMSYEDAKKLMLIKKFKSMHDYRRWQQSDDYNVSLPSNPYTSYGNEWKGWPDFLGKNFKESV